MNDGNEKALGIDDTRDEPTAALPHTKYKSDESLCTQDKSDGSPRTEDKSNKTLSKEHKSDEALYIDDAVLSSDDSFSSDGEQILVLSNQSYVPSSGSDDESELSWQSQDFTLSADEYKRIENTLFNKDTLTTGVSVYPESLRKHFGAYHPAILECLQYHPSDVVVVAAQSMLGDPVLQPPGGVLADVCVLSATQPVMVLTFVGRGKLKGSHGYYNSQLTRLMKKAFTRDMKIRFSAVHGVVEDSLSLVKFKERVQELHQNAMVMSFPDDLRMTDQKLDNIIAHLKDVQHHTQEAKTRDSDEMAFNQEMYGYSGAGHELGFGHKSRQDRGSISSVSSDVIDVSSTSEDHLPGSGRKSQQNLGSVWSMMSDSSGYSSASGVSAESEYRQTLTLATTVETITVNWLQKGRQRHERYILCEYKTQTGQLVPVYIQQDFPVRERLEISGALQYGVQNGVVFYVKHNKKNTPYQHRFVRTDFQKYLYAASEAFKVDLPTYFEQYLNDVGGAVEAMTGGQSDRSTTVGHVGGNLTVN